jgi:hypothetical protein
MEFNETTFPFNIDGDRVSDLMVLKSNAWYIGRLYYDFEIGAALPYSRDSQYFATKHDARRALDTGNFYRDCVENNWNYSRHPELIPDTNNPDIPKSRDLEWDERP